MSDVKPDFTYLNHIRDSCQDIIEFSAGLSLEDFLKDKKTQAAVIRNFEVIGEATKHLSPSFRKTHSHIEWKKIAGLRDKLIHDYMGVDLWAVYSLAKDVIPSFLSDIEKIITAK